MREDGGAETGARIESSLRKVCPQGVERVGASTASEWDRSQW